MIVYKFAAFIYHYHYLAVLLNLTFNGSRSRASNKRQLLLWSVHHENCTKFVYCISHLEKESTLLCAESYKQQYVSRRKTCVTTQVLLRNCHYYQSVYSWFAIYGSYKKASLLIPTLKCIINVLHMNNTH